MLLGARQFFERRGTPTPPLPYDAEVQYLQSTGTQYIDTGIYCLKKYSFEFKVSVSYDGVSYEDYFGGSSSDSQRGWRFRRDGNSEKVLFSIGNAYTTSGVAMSKNTPHLIAMDGSGAATIDGTSVTLSGISSSFDSSVSLYLFAYSKNNTPYRISNAKFYSFKCTDTDTDTVVRDMIPVRKNGVGYMYDRASGTLFGNDGTGAFLYGPDVTPAFGYVQNGLVAMWDGIENAGWGTHDSAATTWKDLVGSNNLTLAGTAAFGSSYLSVDDSSHVYSSSPITTVGTLEICLSRTDSKNDICLLSLASLGGLNMQNFVSWYNSKLGFSATDATTNVCFAITKQWAACTIAFVPASVGAYVNGNSVSTLSERFYYSNAQNYGGVSINPTVVNNRMSGLWYSIRVYSRELSSSEILTNHNVDKARFNLP